MQKLLSAAFLLLIPSPVFAALTINIAPQAGSSTNLQVGEMSTFNITLDFVDDPNALPDPGDRLTHFDIRIVENGLGGSIDFGSISFAQPAFMGPGPMTSFIDTSDPSAPRLNWRPSGAAPQLVNNGSILLATFNVTATSPGDVQLRLREEQGQTGGNPNPQGDNPAADLILEQGASPGAFDADVFTVPGGAAGAPAFAQSTVTLNITAVPEPSSMMLVGLGLAAFGLRRRRS